MHNHKANSDNPNEIIEKHEKRKNNKSRNGNEKNQNGDKTEGFEERFYTSLSHDIRRKIIKIIGTNGKASFTELKKEIQISTGVLYHHLEQLAQLIERDERKKYHLTGLGDHAYRFLDINMDSIESEKFKETTAQEENVHPFYTRLSLNQFVKLILNNRILFFSLPIITLFTLSFLCYWLNVDSYLFFYFGDSNLEFSVLKFFGPILGYFLSVMTCEFLSRYVFHRTESIKPLLGLFPLSFIPSIFYLLIYSFFKDTISIETSPIFNILMVVFQFWSLAILINVLIQTKSIKFERALFIVILLEYFAFTIIIIFRTPIFL